MSLKFKTFYNFCKPKAARPTTLAAPEIDWLPRYKVIRHPRAKRVKLRASALGGIEITIPPRFSMTRLSPIIESHKDWILAHLCQKELIIPHEIRVVEEVWIVALNEPPGRSFVDQRARTIHISATNIDIPGIKRKLEAASRLLAKRKLLPLLAEISLEIGLTYKNARIRTQKTRWGSCTSQKTISLNDRLIFFPKSIIRYVIIHELCHTIHMNHTKAFWDLVAQYDADWKQHRKQLKQTEQYLPAIFCDS